MNKRRLLKLADLLEADAKNRKGIKFYYYSWGEVADPAKPMSCGTEACALGLAALSGAFNRQGLGYRLSGSEVQITFNGRYGPLGAAAKLFEISSRDASFLFASNPCTDTSSGAVAERAVARRIRDFVAGKAAP